MVAKSSAGSPKKSWQERSVAAIAALRRGATFAGIPLLKSPGRGVQCDCQPTGRPRRNWVRQAPSVPRSGRAVKPSDWSFSINGEGRNGEMRSKPSSGASAATVLMILRKGSSPRAISGRTSSVRTFLVIGFMDVR